MIGWILFTGLLMFDVGFLFGCVFKGLIDRSKTNENIISEGTTEKKVIKPSYDAKKYQDDLDFLLNFDGKERKDDEQ